MSSLNFSYFLSLLLGNWARLQLNSRPNVSVTKGFSANWHGLSQLENNMRSLFINKYVMLRVLG